MKKEAEPATVAQLKEWALIIKVEDDIESYEDGQMSIALGVLELIEEYEAMQNGRYSEY